MTGKKTQSLEAIKIYAASHYVTPRPTLHQAIESIKSELKYRLAYYRQEGRLLEAQRLEQRTQFDLEMLEASGVCAGIENYSRFLTGRPSGAPPPTFLNICPKTRFCLSMRATYQSPRLAACTKAISAGKPHYLNMVSGCPLVWTIAR